MRGLRCRGAREPASCTKVAAGECPGHDVLKASATKHVSKRGLFPLALAVPTSVNVAAVEAALSRRGGGSTVCVLDFHRGARRFNSLLVRRFFFFLHIW